MRRRIRRGPPIAILRKTSIRFSLSAEISARFLRNQMLEVYSSRRIPIYPNYGKSFRNSRNPHAKKMYRGSPVTQFRSFLHHRHIYYKLSLSAFLVSPQAFRVLLFPHSFRYSFRLQEIWIYNEIPRILFWSTPVACFSYLSLVRRIAQLTSCSNSSQLPNKSPPFRSDRPVEVSSVNFFSVADFAVSKPPDKVPGFYPVRSFSRIPHRDDIDIFTY